MSRLVVGLSVLVSFAYSVSQGSASDSLESFEEDLGGNQFTLMLDENKNPCGLTSGEDELGSGNETKTILDISVIVPDVQDDTSFQLDFGPRVSDEEKASKVPGFGLSIDGGGYRGLIPSYWIPELEDVLKEEHKKGITDIFDCTGGTSIGGILALGVVHPSFEVHGLTDLLKDNGLSIFPPVSDTRINVDGTGWFKPLIKGVKNIFGYAKTESMNLIACRYDHEPLEKLLKSNFGEVTVENALSDFLITTCSVQGSPRAYTKDTDREVKFWELGRATSAAPTYFKPFPMPSEQPGFQNVKLVDGGIWMNNPSILVAGRIMKKNNISLENLHILSMGTGLSVMSRDLPEVYSGKLTAAGPIIDALMTSNSIGNHQALDYMMKPGNYRRINPRLNNPILLDDVSNEASKEMEELAIGSLGSIEDIISSWKDDISKKLEALEK